MTDEAIALLAPRIGTRAACAASGVPQATWYRRHRLSPPPKAAPVPHTARVQPRALAAAERTAILDALHSDRFADLAPDEIWATLLDEGTWTDHGTARQERGLKHRAEHETRTIPIPPELVKLLRAHIKRYGTTPDGRIFQTARAGILQDSAYGEVWRPARRPSPRPSAGRRPAAAPTTCAMPLSPCGSTRGCPSPRWPAAPGTASPSC